jgi:hypothetical protein
MDLADLCFLSKYNTKYIHILNEIDIFSRYASNVPLKDKDGSSITAALKSLFLNRKQITLKSEKGTEFVNTTVQPYLK